MLFQPCADSGSPAGVFGVLRPRQQFEWAATATGSQARLITNSTTDCLTFATESQSGANHLFISRCIEPLHPTQNFSVAPSSGGGGSAGAGASAAGVQNGQGGQICGELSCTSAYMTRNMPASIISNTSCLHGPCVTYDQKEHAFRSLTASGEANLCLSVGPAVRKLV